jgi:di/tricarboxylate transporter
MMVYGPGGYRFTDYMRVGIPLSIAVVSTIVLTVVVLS